MSSTTLSAVAAESTAREPAPASRLYAWSVFALTFGLMLSDYLSRQVIGGVMPALKIEWGLLDSQLAMLVSVVSLVVGVLTVPVSLVADRWGRVRSITLMAFVWCLATVACGLAQSHGQLLWARAFVGVGEAAYGAAGGALAGPCVPGAPARRGARRLPVGQSVRRGARRRPRRHRHDPFRLAHGLLHRRRTGPAAGGDLSVRRARLQDRSADQCRQGWRRGEAP